MRAEATITRCGFAIVKLKMDGQSFYLMRKDHKWNDVTFLGGHQNTDDGSLMRTARRELLEEVPPFRKVKGISLEPLSEEIVHGPVFSKSAGRENTYAFGFYIVRFSADPTESLEGLGPRSHNLMVPEIALRSPGNYQVASIVGLLAASRKEGLPSIPFSWDEDLSISVEGNANSVLHQRHLAF